MKFCKPHSAFIALLILVSCKKDTIVTSPIAEAQVPPVLEFQFRALVNGVPLQATSGTYSNAGGDQYSITKFNYYISNIKLKKDDGTYFSEAESYHLVQHVEGKTNFTVQNVPAGNYTALEFLIGVDSLRNISGAQTGALDPANQMFWDWSTGYIFYKLEGAYTSPTISEKSDYAIHIGGFAGKFSCLQKVLINLPSTLSVKINGKSKISFNTVIDEVFKTPAYLDFDTYYAKPPDLAMFKLISDNYKDMFVVEKVETN